MIPFGAIRGLLYIIPPLFIVLFQNIGAEDLRRPLIVLLIIFGSILFSFGYQFLNWHFYSYRYEGGYLHIKSGVIIKKERSIKQERVQTVNIRRGLIQRLFGLASLQVETAGGGAESELSLAAVTLEEAYNIKSSLEGLEMDHVTVPDNKLPDAAEKAEGNEGKRTIPRLDLKAAFSPALSFGEEAGAEHDQEAGTLYRITIRELFLAGATSGGFFVLFSVIGLAFSQAIPYIPDTFWDDLMEQVTTTAAGTVVLVVTVLLVLSWFISTLGFMVQYANFTLQRHQNRLLVTWGLIEQKQLALNLNRLQALAIHEGILRQPFGRCALVAEVAGGGSSDQNHITLLFPLLRTAELNQFLDRIIPEFYLPESFTPLPTRAKRRYIFRAAAPTLLLIIPLQWAPYGWLSFFILIPAIFWGYSRYCAGGTALDDRQLALRFRFVNRFHIMVLRNCVQALQVSVNPFQRWWDLRSVKSWVLSSPSGKAFQVADVEETEARRIWDWYSRSK